jgi:hypothetical protein
MEKAMKKLGILVMAIFLLSAVAVWGQEAQAPAQQEAPKDAQQNPNEPKMAQEMDKTGAAPLKTFKGMVKSEGGKLSVVADRDHKVWAVTNPESLAGHEGHHVMVTAHVYPSKHEIHVMNVKMVKTETAAPTSGMQMPKDNK